MNWKKKKEKWHMGVEEWKSLTASHSKVKIWNLKEEVLDLPLHNYPKKEISFEFKKWEKVQEKWNCEI